MYGRIFIVCVILVAAGNARAETSLFLYPKISQKTKITISDIAKIESGSSTVKLLGDVVIEPQLYRDGFIDRSELYALLRKYTSETVFVYGYATRVISESIQSEKKESIVIKQGQHVKVIVKYKGITIETSGIAQRTGSSGDRIPVKMNKKKIIQCKILYNGTAVKSL